MTEIQPVDVSRFVTHIPMEYRAKVAEHLAQDLVHREAGFVWKVFVFGDRVLFDWVKKAYYYSGVSPRFITRLVESGQLQGRDPSNSDVLILGPGQPSPAIQVEIDHWASWFDRPDFELETT